VIGTDKYKLLKAVRNDVSFHYLDQTVRKALASQKAKAPTVLLSLSVGDGTLDWYFEPADRLVDSTIVRDVFAIPEGADVQKEVDKLIHGLQDIADAFVLFAGYFIMENAN